LGEKSSVHKSHTARNIVLTFVVLIVIFGGGTLALSYLNSPAVRNPQVIVSGRVSTVGFGTTPNRVDFTSDNGQVYSSPVSNGQYSVTLPNGHSYTITVAWSSAAGGIISGTCNGGTVNLANFPSNTDSYDISC
jgi:hypothetical protein